MLTAKCHRLTTLALECQYKTTSQDMPGTHTRTHALKHTYTSTDTFKATPHQELRIQAPRGDRQRQWEAVRGPRRMPDFKYSSLPSAANPSIYLCHCGTQVMEGGNGKSGKKARKRMKQETST